MVRSAWYLLSNSMATDPFHSLVGNARTASSDR